MAVGGVRMTDLHPVKSTDASRVFEIIWDRYVAYSVRNESFVTPDDFEESAWGRRVRLYSRSHFLEYVSRATFACDEHPGPLQHVGVHCENHIVDVVSAHAPRIRRLWPA